MGWAEDQIKKERSEQESKKINNEIRAWDNRLKAEVGKGCFEKIKSYVSTQVEKYNKTQSGQSGGIFFLPDSSVEEERDIMSRIPSFTIFRRDQPRAHLYVKYSEPQHAILWRCGSAEGGYEVIARPDGKCHLAGVDGNPRTPEQIGNELLDRASRAEPIGGGPWM